MFGRSNSMEREDTSPPATSPVGLGVSGRRASWSGGPSPREQLGAERTLRRRRQTSNDGVSPPAEPSTRSLSGGFSFFGGSPALAPVDEGSVLMDRGYSGSVGSRRHSSAAPPPLLQLPRTPTVPIQLGNSVGSSGAVDDNKRAKQMGLLAGAASLVAVYSASTIL